METIGATIREGRVVLIDNGEQASTSSLTISNYLNNNLVSTLYAFSDYIGPTYYNSSTHEELASAQLITIEDHSFCIARGDTFEAYMRSSTSKATSAKSAILKLHPINNSSIYTNLTCEENASSLYIKRENKYMYAMVEDTGDVMIFLTDGTNNTLIKSTGIITPTVTQTSKESVKKNIEKYLDNASDIVKNSEIYKYNFKSEDDTARKHIGFVIGDEGGNYKTPDEVVSNGEGIDTYTMTSILWKAVQEQQEIIEQMQKEINELKGGN
jgi:tyrosine-protein phosphatase YwqE